MVRSTHTAHAVAVAALAKAGERSAAAEISSHNQELVVAVHFEIQKVIGEMYVHKDPTLYVFSVKVIGPQLRDTLELLLKSVSDTTTCLEFIEDYSIPTELPYGNNLIEPLFHSRVVDALKAIKRAKPELFIEFKHYAERIGGNKPIRRVFHALLSAHVNGRVVS